MTTRYYEETEYEHGVIAHNRYAVIPIPEEE